jgi:heme exporter protein A
MEASGLTAQDLFCRRGDRLLFGSLDLRADRGAAIHLVGPNGVGKTSLLRILAGLLRPSPTGFDDRGLPSRGRFSWQGTVGLLDGNLPLDEQLPLGRALRFWRAVDGHAADFDRLGLSGLLEVPVRFLSTGQRKRAALACLVGQRVDHWLLDEPLNGLDIDGAGLVEGLIAERRAGGGVVVVASHQPIDLPNAQVVDLRDHPH